MKHVKCPKCGKMWAKVQSAPRCCGGRIGNSASGRKGGQTKGRLGGDRLDVGGLPEMDAGAMAGVLPLMAALAKKKSRLGEEPLFIQPKAEEGGKEDGQ